jgi:hypothetical protein
MSLLQTRAEKLALLNKIVSGSVTPKQITQFQISREPIQVTMKLTDDEFADYHDPIEPTYHIEVSLIAGQSNNVVRYYRHPDGRIDYLPD